MKETREKGISLATLENVFEMSGKIKHGNARKSDEIKKATYNKQFRPLLMNVYILDEEDVLQILLKDRRTKEARKD